MSTWGTYLFEGFFFLYFLAYFTTQPTETSFLVSQIKTDNVSSIGSNITQTSTNSCVDGGKDMEDVMFGVLEQLTWLQSSNKLPAAVTAVVLGLWSDASRRRKFLLWIPSFGNVILSLGLILGVYCDTKDTMKILYGSLGVSGAMGGIHVYMIGVGGYIADHIEPRRMLFRFCVAEVVLVTCESLGFTLSAFTTPRTLFIPTLWAVFALSYFTYSATLQGMFETDAACKFPWSPFQFINDVPERTRFDPLAPRARATLWLLVMGYFLFALGVEGIKALSSIHLAAAPLCQDLAWIHGFHAGTSRVAALAGLPILFLAWKKKISPWVFLMLGILSTGTGAFIIAFSSGLWMTYLGAAFLALSVLPFPVLRVLCLGLINHESAGTWLGLLSALHALACMLGMLGVVTLYQSTRSMFQWLTMTVLASVVCVTVLPLSIGWRIYRTSAMEETRRRKKEEEEEPRITFTDSDSVMELGPRASFRGQGYDRQSIAVLQIPSPRSRSSSVNSFRSESPRFQYPPYVDHF